MSPALAWCAGPAALSAFPPALPLARAAAPAPMPAPEGERLPPAMVWLMLARRAVAAESHEEALRCFDRALRHEPQLPLARLGRAMCLAQLGREAEAEEETQRLIALGQGQEDVLYQLARACARDGRVAFGVAFLTEAVRVRPALEEKAARDVLFADHPAYLQAIGRL